MVESMPQIDFRICAESLADGTADEYLERIGQFPAEALLEEQDDKRTWSELGQDEQDRLAAMLAAYARNSDCTFERTDAYCIVSVCSQH